jgi:hypothetical protein
VLLGIDGNNSDDEIVCKHTSFGCAPLVEGRYTLTAVNKTTNIQKQFRCREKMKERERERDRETERERRK